MVGKELTETIDAGIKLAQKGIGGLPSEVNKRIVELKTGPREVISRIKQIDGLIVEFEER